MTITSSKDNTLYESPTGGISNGSGPGMYTGLTNTSNHRRALVAFDLASAIPAGSTVNDATLTLNVSQASFGVPVTVELRPVLADWGEGASVGSGQGALAQPGDATWIHRFYNTSTWTNPGGDFSSTATGSAQVDTIGPITYDTSASMRTLAQQWLDTPATNFGWMLWTNEASLGVAVRFSTREDTATLRPMLTIDYTAPVVGGNSTWKDDLDGNWSDPARWSGSVPNGAGFTATFGPAALAPRTVTVDAPQTVGTINFDNANKYTIAGSSTITLDNSIAGVAINVITGSHDITAPLTLAKDATITITPAGSRLGVSALQPAPTRALTKAGAGDLALHGVHVATLSINSGTVTIIPSAGSPSSLGLLSVSAGATLDLNDNDLVTGTPKATIENLVKAARNGGAWNQPGITSTNARSTATTGLGVLSGAEYSSVGGTGTFSGQTYAAGDTLVKYTWNGDANLDGRVTFDDYVKIDTGFNTGLTGWLNGDFNYSGNVNFDDYVLIDIAFNQQNGTLSRAIDWISGDDRSTVGLDNAQLGEAINHLNRFGASYGAAFLAAVPEPTTTIAGGLVLTSVALRRRRARMKPAFSAAVRV